MEKMKRLAQPTGQIEDRKIGEESNDKLVRPAILVHSGSEGEKVTFMSGDGEISFDDARIKRIVNNHNAKINTLAEGYGGVEKMPAGAFPPILDQHENDSNNRIVGRLASLLRFEKRDIPGVGKNVACACADITFLGEDTVKRVKDGRIYHLSIGIDEASDTLGETSTVITPAAPGAMLLKKGDSNMSKKNLAARQARMVKLAEMQKSLTTLTTKITEANKSMKLAKKESEVTHRLTGLMRSGKLTPAEMKKMDVKNLASLDEKSLNTVLSTIEAMEPKIMAGQRGSTDSMDVSTIAKNLTKANLKKLKSETMNDMRKLSGKKLFDKEEEIEDKEHKMAAEEIQAPKKDEHAVSGQEGDEVQLKKMYEDQSAHHETMKAHLEAGNIEEAKKHHEIMHACHMEMGKHLCGNMKHMEIGDVKSEDYKKSQDNLQAQVDELNTQMARIAGMVNELMEVEKEEGEELETEAVTPEQKKVAEEHKSLESETKTDIVPKKEDETQPKA